MKKLKSLLLESCVLLVLLTSNQICFAKVTTPIIIIRKDDSKDPTPTQTNVVSSFINYSKPINYTEK